MAKTVKSKKLQRKQHSQKFESGQTQWIIGSIVVVVFFIGIYYVMTLKEKFVDDELITGDVRWERSNLENKLPCIGNFFCDGKGGYAVFSTGPATGKFTIRGSPNNTIPTAKGGYLENTRQFDNMENFKAGTQFNTSDYVWSSKGSTWRFDMPTQLWLQSLDDIKCTLYRKRDMAPFSTWTERKNLRTQRYWGFVPGGTPMSEFSCLSLQKSGIPKI